MRSRSYGILGALAVVWLGGICCLIVSRCGLDEPEPELIRVTEIPCDEKIVAFDDGVIITGPMTDADEPQSYTLRITRTGEPLRIVKECRK